MIANRKTCYRVGEWSGEINGSHRREIARRHPEDTRRRRRARVRPSRFRAPRARSTDRSALPPAANKDRTRAAVRAVRITRQLVTGVNVRRLSQRPRREIAVRYYRSASSRRRGSTREIAPFSFFLDSRASAYTLISSFFFSFLPLFAAYNLLRNEKSTGERKGSYRCTVARDY